MKAKKNRKIWIVIAIVTVLLIAIVVGVVYYIYESSLPGTREGRSTAIQIAKDQLEDVYYRNSKDYDYKIESVDENGTYKVRLQQDGDNTDLYYFINPDTGETVFFWEPEE